MTLLNEFIKNTKIIFRNWASLSLLVIAPLVLILLIGYAFSSEAVSGIRIGIVSYEKIDLEPLQNNISSYGTIIEFQGIENCLADMALQRIHICIELRNITFEQNRTRNPATGTIAYYYDNTRKKLSLNLINNIQDFFGLQAEQMSIESAESIFTNINNLIVFLTERRMDITEMRNQSMVLRGDITARNEKLKEVRSRFLTSYFIIKGIQEELHNYSIQVFRESEALGSAVEEINWTIGELSNTTLDNQSNLTADLSGLQNDLNEVSRSLDTTAADVTYLSYVVDELVARLDNIKSLLDSEIIRNEEYIMKINESIVKIDAISAELDQKLEQLSGLEPGVAERLVRPILFEYHVLLKGARNIQLSFPQLLVIIIMFISLLFANIASLMELHDRAHLRNLIAPVNSIIFSAGMIFTSIIIIFLQIIVLFIVAQTRLGIDIGGFFWQLSFISLLLITVFVLIGMIFSYLFKSIQSSVLITTFSALIFFMFSNALSPVEAMPLYARILSSYNPLLIGEFLVKQVQLFHTPLGLLNLKILLLVAYIAALFIVLALLSRRRAAQ